ncbi:MAG: hypothetical protein KAI53_03860, partial [Candidatus Aenigmarchaeota archaeon]|nr:hypothetical protein [Candidatus Aenigmarchaeota archaeon]
MIPNIYLLLKLSRPAFWSIPLLVFLLGLTYADAKLTYLAVVQLLLLSLPFSVFLYGINDIYDYESDKLNPRKKGVQGIKLKQKYHSFIKKFSFFVILLLLFSSIITLNFSNIIGMIILLFFSYHYSAHPLRFKVKPPMDSFSNGMIYF